MRLPRIVRTYYRRGLVRTGLRPAVVHVKPTRALAMSDFARRSGVRWDVVRPAITPVRDAFIRFGPREADLTTRMEPIPDLGVLRAPGLILVGPLGLPVTQNGDLLSDASFWHGFPTGLPNTPVTQVRRIRGTLVSLMSDFALTNYGHYLLDALPRLALLEQAGVSLEEADHIYCGAPSARASRLLDALGVPLDRRIAARPGEAICADLSIVTSYPGGRRNYPPWVPEFLRQRLSVASAPATRRLYIGRAGHRLVLNIEELMPTLAAHGFEAFDPTGPEDPRQAFAEAAVVVGAHGAGLADLAFCRPGAAVLELLPDSHPMPFYATLAASAGLHYGYLMGDGAVPLDHRPRSRWDFRVDLGLFQEAIEGTLGRSAPVADPVSSTVGEDTMSHAHRA